MLFTGVQSERNGYFMPDTNNKSLYIYTGLIFLVAVILIIVSFFGQSKLEKNQPIPISQEEARSVTDRAAVLSDENKTLLEENMSLKKQIEEQVGEITEKNAKLEIYRKSNENTSLLLSANGFVSMKKYDEARTVLESVDITLLTEDEKILYKNIEKTIENNGK